MVNLNVKRIFIDAFCNLNKQFLLKLDEDAFYSTNTKREIIIELENVFNKIRETGIVAMKPVKSMCKYCHPDGDAYSFYNPI